MIDLPVCASYNASVYDMGNANKSILVYSNPFSDILNISSEKLDDNIQTAELFDINGKLIYKFDNKFKSNKMSINLGGYLNKGTYLLRIKTDRFIMTKKLIHE